MTCLEHTALIRKPTAEIYALCKQVERYSDFLPGYLESTIIERKENRFLLDRSAFVKGRLYRWKSWVHFEENRAIHFEHAEGPLKGMRVVWLFDALSPTSTRVVITHHFHVNRSFGIGFLLERFVFRPRINAIAAQVVDALKHVCEKNIQEAVSL